MSGLFFAQADSDSDRFTAPISADQFTRKKSDRPYDISILIEENDTILGYSCNCNYPVHTFENGRFIILIDGNIYNKLPIKFQEELLIIADAVSRDSVKYRKIISDWVSETDGDYVVALFDRSNNNFCLFNDRLGRLPVYYSQTEKLLLVSRNPWDIVNISGSSKLDRVSIAEYLLFGYALGDRTFLKNIFQIKGGSCLRTHGKSGSSSIERLYTYNFDEKTSGSEKLSDHADNIIELLIEDCGNRVDSKYATVLALSGGLDSRTVAICLKKNKMAFSAETFLDYYGIFKPDAEYAKQIASALGINHNIFHLPRASGRDALDLLDLKCGMNYLGVSFSLPMIKGIMEKHGEKITLFTGDGGDRILRDTTPARHISSHEDLIKYIVKCNSIMRLDVVASLTGTDESEILLRLSDHVRSYEETDLRMKYLHFIFYERCPKWHFQGEDRNREYVRHVTPFYSSRLIEYSFGLPDRLKKNFRLYREILRKLSPTVAEIPNPEWNFPITSRKLAAYNLARELYFYLPDRIKSVIQRRHRYTKKASVYSTESPVMICLDSQLRNCSAIRDYLSADEIHRNVNRLDKMGFDHLITLTSLIELLHNGSSSIDKFSDTDFL